VGTRADFPWKENLPLLKDEFVCVALNVDPMVRRQDREGEFFRKLVDEGKFQYACGRMHGMTADGKFLCHRGGSTDHLWRDCDARGAWAEWIKLPASERRPGAISVGERGSVDPKLPKPPPSGLILKAYSSHLDRDRAAGFRRRDKFLGGFASWAPYEPGREYVWLTEADWKAFVPADPRKGARVPVTPPLAHRLLLGVLTDNSTSCGVHWEPGHVRSLDLSLMVEESSAVALRMRLEGSIVLAHETQAEPASKEAREKLLREFADWNPDPKASPRYEARLLGYLTYDLKKNAFDRFDIVALGDYTAHTYSPFRADGPGHPQTIILKPYALDISIETARADQIVPPAGYR